METHSFSPNARAKSRLLSLVFVGKLFHSSGASDWSHHLPISRVGRFHFFRRMRDFGAILSDSVSVEDFYNLRFGWCVGRSIDISMEGSVDNVHAHAFSVVINSGAML